MRIDAYSSLTAHGFHRVAYTDWGDRANPHVVICVHGLTRNARDFDFLAETLSSDCRVVCPDIVGRGASDWLPHKKDYGYPLYLTDMAALIARVGTKPVRSRWDALWRRLRGRRDEPRIDWVGTSMGALIGMMLAAQPQSPIQRLVINDAGPFVPRAALQRIAAYVGKDPRFGAVDELEQYLRKFCASFGPLTDTQWRHLATHSSRQGKDGSYGFSYDPGIAEPFRGSLFYDVDLWPLWDKIRCPVLILRGADSDLLLHKTAQEMLTRGPRTRLVEFAGVGHAPMLMAQDQIDAVREFLLGDD
ncbi:MAG: alpha/beta fold hydrolase [Burkholderiales bacterium]|nr:alpha/beta hydrolase [Pseudomonadota bacterium]